jgi:hypothetical protein
VTPGKPEGFQVWPGFSKCLKSLGQLLKATLSTSVSYPSEKPPFRSRSLCQVTRTVVNVPAAFDPAANAAGNALAAAAGALTGVVTDALIGGSGPTGQSQNLDQVQNLTPTALAPPFDPIPVWQYRTPQGYAAIWKSWGLTVETGDPLGARTSARVEGGPNTGSVGPNPLTSGALKFLHQPTTIILPENKLLQVLVQNLDVNSPMLVTTSVCGWLIPIRQWKDKPESLVPEAGYGIDCEGF